MRLLNALGTLGSSFLAGVQSAFVETKATSDPFLEAFRTAFLTGEDLTANNITRAMERHPFVYTAVDKIVTNLSSVEIELFRGRSTRPVLSDPVLELLESPNSVMTGVDLRESKAQWLELEGNAFWLKNKATRPSAGEAPLPTELLPLNPQFVAPLPLGNSQVHTGWQYRIGGEVVDLPLEAVCWFRFPNPYDARWGLSPIRALVVEVLGDASAAKWNASFFKGSAVPEGVISLPREAGNVPDTEIERMRQLWYQHHNSETASHRPAVLTRGATYTETGRSQRDAQFLMGREFAREIIFGAYGVPPGVAGVMKFANYANLAVQKRQFWSDTLIPKLVRDQAQMTFGLFGPRSERQLRYNMDRAASLAEDFDQKVETAARLFTMGNPLERINQRMNMRLDLQGLESASEAFLPVSMAPASAILEPPEPAEPPAPEPEEPEDPDDEPSGDEPDASEPVEPNEPQEAPEEAALRLGAEFLKGFAPAVALRRGLNVDEAQSLQLFDGTARDAQLVAMTQASIKSAYGAGGAAVWSEAGLAGAFLATDPAAVTFFASKAIMARAINARVRDVLHGTIREVVTSGLEGKQGATEIATNLKLALDGKLKITRSRSLTIARTEAGEAYSTGRYQGMAQGKIQHHQWLIADGEARDSHAAEDGNIVALGETFPSTGLRYPMDPAGPAKEVINCRCVAVASQPPERSLPWKQVRRPVVGITNALERKLRSYFTSLRVEVLRNLDAFLEAVAE